MPKYKISAEFIIDAVDEDEAYEIVEEKLYNGDYRDPGDWDFEEVEG